MSLGDKEIGLTFRFSAEVETNRQLQKGNSKQGYQCESQIHGLLKKCGERREGLGHFGGLQAGEPTPSGVLRQGLRLGCGPGLFPSCSGKTSCPSPSSFPPPFCPLGRKAPPSLLEGMGKKLGKPPLTLGGHQAWCPAVPPTPEVSGTCVCAHTCMLCGSHHSEECLEASGS